MGEIMKILLATLLTLASLSSQAAFFCGTVEEIQGQTVTYNLVGDDGNISNSRLSLDESVETIALAKLIIGNNQMKLCTHDHASINKLDSQYITNTDRLVK
jgi:hypothetical protein